MGRILLVEDEESLRDVLARYLETQGHTCAFAETGAIGVERVREDVEGFDLIISDIEMPVMDGMTFLKNVQPYVESVTPFMILTAYDELALRHGGHPPRRLQLPPEEPLRPRRRSRRPWSARSEIREMYKLRLNHRAQLEAEVRAKTRELQSTYEGTVIALGRHDRGQGHQHPAAPVPRARVLSSACEEAPVAGQAHAPARAG